MFKQKSSPWFVLVLLTIAVSFSLLTGCGSSSSSSDDSESADVTLTATPAAIAITSSAVLEAFVQSNSVGLADQEVTFSVSPSASGTCTPAVDTTDADGVAATIFTPSATGSVVVTATVGGSSVTTNITVTEEGEVGSGTVNLTVTPTLLFADGADTARVTVLVRDANANPAPDQTLVKLCAGEKFVDRDGNGYWSDGIDSLVYDLNNNEEWDAVGLIPSTAYVTGGTGTASVDFVSGERAGTFYILATVDEGGITGADEQSIQLNPSATLHSIFLAASDMNLVVAHTGGIETGELRATGYDIYGNRVPEGMSITFTILDGPDGGEFIGTDPAATEVIAVTNGQGVATVPIHSGTISGTIRIRAYSGTILSNATQIMVSAGPPKYIVVGAEDLNVPFWATVNERNGIVAVVSDTFLNPVNDSTVVYFSCDEGSMISHEERTQDLEGVAGTEWISGNNVATADGVVWVCAETSGGTVFDSLYFYNSWYLHTIIAIPDSIGLYAGSGMGNWISITGFDANGNPVDDGTQVEFAADEYVTISNAVLHDGYITAADMIEVVASSPLPVDFSETGAADDGVGGVMYVFSEVLGAQYYTFKVVLFTGAAYSENCEIVVPSAVAPSTTVNITAKIADRFGNPLADHTLVLTASAGVEVVDTDDTNEYGEVTSFLWTSPGAAGTVTLTVTDTDALGGITMSATVNVE